MAHFHPLTKIEYEYQDAYVEALIESYVTIKRDLFALDVKEEKLVSALDSFVRDDIRRGTSIVDGLKQRAKITRKLNISYPRERGEKHPLRTLLKQFDELGEMVIVDYKEKGAALQALCDRHREDKLKLDDAEDLAEALIKVRVEKPAKPSIIIEDRPDA